MTRHPILAGLAAAGLALALLAGTAIGPAAAADARTVRLTGDLTQTKKLVLPLGKSMFLELDEDVRDVMVGNPAVADVVVRSARRVYVVGTGLGATNVFLFGANGRQIVQLDLQVEPATGYLDDIIRRLVPGATIQVEAVNGSVVLSGVVPTAADARRAEDLAVKFLGGDDAASKKVVNALTIKGKDQVHLKVTVAEIQRNIVKQLGVDLDALVQSGNIVTGIMTQNPLNILGKTFTTSAYGATACFQSVGGTCTRYVSGTIRALEQNGVLRTLAEPTLTAISGEEAQFLVGGEFPVPVGRENDRITIEFKKYGISLAFVPVVLSEGRISIKVKTEVSEITNEGSIILADTTIPGLRVRRADSTVELPSGGTIVLAGLVRDDTRAVLNGTPGLMSLPILGALFKSRDFQRNQTELAIFVTPYIVDPVATSKIVRPDQNFQPAGDASAIFLGRLNRIYRPAPLPDPSVPVPGRYGFIYD